MRLLSLVFCVSRRDKEKLRIVKKMLNGLYLLKMFNFKLLKKNL